jgi:hypothetical protein
VFYIYIAAYISLLQIDIHICCESKDLNIYTYMYIGRKAAVLAVKRLSESITQLPDRENKRSKRLNSKCSALGINIYTYTYIYIYIYMYIYIHMHIFTHIYIYLNIQLHTYTYTYIFLNTCINKVIYMDMTL